MCEYCKYRSYCLTCDRHWHEHVFYICNECKAKNCEKNNICNFCETIIKKEEDTK